MMSDAQLNKEPFDFNVRNFLFETAKKAGLDDKDSNKLSRRWMTWALKMADPAFPVKAHEAGGLFCTGGHPEITQRWILPLP